MRLRMRVLGGEVEDEADRAHEEDWLAITIGTTLLMFTIALAIGQWLHHKHIYWLPESAATILVGFVVRAPPAA